MMDVVDQATRSRMMASIHGRDTRPELLVRSLLHRAGLRFRVYGSLPGHPDLVLSRYKAIVFVHGCFWHRHRGCKYATTPATNAEFWQRKFVENVRRDQRVERQLRRAGWHVFVVWTCRIDERTIGILANRIRRGGS